MRQLLLLLPALVFSLSILSISAYGAEEGGGMTSAKKTNAMGGNSKGSAAELSLGGTENGGTDLTILQVPEGFGNWIKRGDFDEVERYSETNKARLERRRSKLEGDIGDGERKVSDLENLIVGLDARETADIDKLVKQIKLRYKAERDCLEERKNGAESALQRLREMLVKLGLQGYALEALMEKLDEIVEKQNAYIEADEAYRVQLVKQQEFEKKLATLDADRKKLEASRTQAENDKKKALQKYKEDDKKLKEQAKALEEKKEKKDELREEIEVEVQAALEACTAKECKNEDFQEELMALIKEAPEALKALKLPETLDDALRDPSRSPSVLSDRLESSSRVISPPAVLSSPSFRRSSPEMEEPLKLAAAPPGKRQGKSPLAKKAASVPRSMTKGAEAPSDQELLTGEGTSSRPPEVTFSPEGIGGKPLSDDEVEGESGMALSRPMATLSKGSDTPPAKVPASLKRNPIPSVVYKDPLLTVVLGGDDEVGSSTYASTSTGKEPPRPVKAAGGKGGKKAPFFMSKTLEGTDTLRNVARGELLYNIDELEKRILPGGVWKALLCLRDPVASYLGKAKSLRFSHEVQLEDESLLTHDFYDVSSSSKEVGETLSVSFFGEHPVTRVPYNGYVREYYKVNPKHPSEVRAITLDLLAAPLRKESVLFKGDRVVSIEIDLRGQNGIMIDNIFHPKVTIKIWKGAVDECQEITAYLGGLGVTSSKFLSQSIKARTKTAERDKLYAFRQSLPFAPKGKSAPQPLPGFYTMYDPAVLHYILDKALQAGHEGNISELFARITAPLPNGERILSVENQESTRMLQPIRWIERSQSGRTFLLADDDEYLDLETDHAKKGHRSSLLKDKNPNPAPVVFRLPAL